jgi:hypothetical protein
MPTTRACLYHANEQITKAMTAVEADTGGSPIFVATMKKFVGKSKNVISALNCADDNLFDLVIELEQSAENAKYELGAAKGLASKTRQKVVDAYTSVVVVKRRRGPCCGDP